MYLFHNDYNISCHSNILQRMALLREESMPAYGKDPHSMAAADTIRTLCKNQDLAVHFLVGGTQTNLTVISAALRPHQAVFCAQSGHINVHETGAIEATGHKVVSVATPDGKLTAQQVEAQVLTQLNDNDAEHCVQIKLVYISLPTELGTVYSLTELIELSKVCRKYGLLLFADGARLSYALSADENDITLADLARLCDVFYIGGTKCGAMFGEAVVISNPAIAEDFRYLIKQHGGMLAKGWLTGLQFEVLFENDLYFSLAAHANKLAGQLRDTLSALGYSFLIPGKTNQVFPILPNALLEKLDQEFTFLLQKRIDDHFSAVRFCTSWATTQESVDALCAALRTLSDN